MKNNSSVGVALILLLIIIHSVTVFTSFSDSNKWWRACVTMKNAGIVSLVGVDGFRDGLLVWGFGSGDITSGKAKGFILFLSIGGAVLWGRVFPENTVRKVTSLENKYIYALLYPNVVAMINDKGDIPKSILIQKTMLYSITSHDKYLYLAGYTENNKSRIIVLKLTKDLDILWGREIVLKHTSITGIPNVIAYDNTIYVYTYNGKYLIEITNDTSIHVYKLPIEIISIINSRGKTIVIGHSSYGEVLAEFDEENKQLHVLLFNISAKLVSTAYSNNTLYLLFLNTSSTMKTNTIITINTETLTIEKAYSILSMNKPFYILGIVNNNPVLLSSLTYDKAVAYYVSLKPGTYSYRNDTRTIIIKSSPLPRITEKILYTVSIEHMDNPVNISASNINLQKEEFRKEYITIDELVFHEETSSTTSTSISVTNNTSTNAIHTTSYTTYSHNLSTTKKSGIIDYIVPVVIISIIAIAVFSVYSTKRK